MARKDYIVAPALEAALILFVALIGWVSHQPFVFASLGPTAFEIIETPERPTARPYNIIVGNLIAILMAYAALAVTHAWSSPSVSAAGVPLPRVWAAVMACFLTVLFTLVCDATQPAAISTALLISLGVMQTLPECLIILSSVVLITAIGEPVRRWRMRDRNI